MDAIRRPPEFERYCRDVNPHWGATLESLGLDRPWVEARGCHLTDDLGRRYLDLSAGFGSALFGHRPARLRRALRARLAARDASLTAFGWSGDAGAVAERLLAQAGPAFGKVQFFSTGAEAVEAAMKFAGIATGRPVVLGLPGGFHGLTGAATALAGGGPWREGTAMPFPGIEHPTGMGLAALRARLARGDVAAVVVEPIQHTAGARVLAPGWLAALSVACRKAGTLLIVDEVMSGIGRSGRWFAFQHAPASFRPDLVVVSKGLTGGLMPVSAVLCTDPVFEAVFAGPGRAKIHGATFAGNALAMACARAALAEAERIDACALARKGEAVFRAAVAQRDRGRLLQVTGRGLLLAVTPVGLPSPRQAAFWWALRDRGVLTVPAAHAPGALVLTPPLVIPAATLRTVAAMMADAARALSPG